MRAISNFFSSIKYAFTFVAVAIATISVLLFLASYFGLHIPFINTSNKLFTITHENQAQTYEIAVLENRVFQYLNGKDLHGIKNVVITTSDSIQQDKYAWGQDKVYSSVTVRVVGETKYITIHIDRTLMGNAGWSENMMAREASVLILQSLILNQNLYTTSQMVSEAREQAISMIKDSNLQNIVTLK